MVAKQVADLLTFTRGLLLIFFPWLAVTGGQESLSLAAMLLISNWTGDVFDGALARRSRIRYDSWIGDHDLEIDIAVALGLLIYTIATGYVQLTVGAIYILIWAMYFWRIRASMMAARVAGVPSPRSDMAAAKASSSTNLPAPSMAESRVDSL